ncbi:MAG: hypothetical protein WKF79_11015 [Nocardioides sp.]
MTSSRRSWPRIAFAVLLAIGWTIVALLSGSFIGIASESLGWLWMGLLLAVGLVSAAFVWGTSNRRLVIGVAVAVAFGIGLVSWYTSPPTHERVIATAETVDIPEGWDEVDEREYGNTWCFQGCPVVQRDYSVPGDLDEARTELVVGLEADGWGVDEDATSDLRLTKGRWEIAVDDLPYTDTPSISLRFSG